MANTIIKFKRTSVLNFSEIHFCQEIPFKDILTHILYAVPYQHFTNSIENYFSMLKSRLQKLDGLTHEKLKENIEKVIKDIPKEKYENIFKGAYNKTEKYVKKPSNRTRKLKNYLPYNRRFKCAKV